MRSVFFCIVLLLSVVGVSHATGYEVTTIEKYSKEEVPEPSFVHKDPNQMDSFKKKEEPKKLESPLIDTSKVLVSTPVVDHEDERAVVVIMRDVPKNDGSVIANAYVEAEDGSMRSDVECEVVKDTVTCSW
jgi:hypothetical protein